MKNLVRTSWQFAFMTLLVATVLTSCNKKSQESSATGWNYNDPEWGGFEVAEETEQKTGPGLVLIPGGTFTMGSVEQDVTYDYNNVARRVTVSSFYMDETEVTNLHYREYLFWMEKVFGETYPELVHSQYPDTLVWHEELSFNDPFVNYYFRHPAYNDYPTVGVNWLQANEYCKWRSDRVNENVLVNDGYIELDQQQYAENNFNTEAYLLGQYEAVEKKGKKNLDPNGAETRRLRFEDGVLLPDYRLPTEAEWEYAALAIISSGDEERFTDRKIYPWEGSSLRFEKHGKWHGDMMANYKRGRGDYAGIAGNLNDNAEVTAPVGTYMPNEFGLYNMAGNVSEWVLDVYRPMTSTDAEDFNPFRGQVFKTMEKDEEGNIAPKDSLGRIARRVLTEDEIGNRKNFRKAYAVNYRDGDEDHISYESDVTTLISDELRVIKGGSWKDLAYYLSPGTRRSMNEEDAAANLGFRCAMIRLGSPDGKKIKTKVKKKY